MISFPNAKINIGLNVTAKRPDGYHNLETVFYPVKINDVLEIVESDELSFASSGTLIPGQAQDNLCLKAYRLLKKDYDIPPVKIHLHKNIPIGAGLGGGSADAAFLIKLLNAKFRLGLPEEAMEDYARPLGADCAFFIKNKPTYAFEKGDRFKDVSFDLSACHLVLVMPPVHVSTADAYRGVTPAQPEHALPELIKRPVAEWRQLVKNDFEVSVFKKYPLVAAVKEQLYQLGALYASMSGSGASVFGIFEHRPDLKHLETGNAVFYNV